MGTVADFQKMIIHTWVYRECIIAYNSLDETLEDVYKRYKSKSPAYCRIKDNWFVVSDNTDDGYIFYQKTVLKDGIFMTAILHYPSSENDYYSTLIPKIFTDFPD